MAVRTHSVFYYGHTVDENNCYINFKEGVGAELTATVPVGTYTLTKFLQVLQTTLNAASALDWTVSVNRTTRIVTITSSGVASLLNGTGSNYLNSALTSLAGFAASDLVNYTSFVGTLPTGEEYVPCFPLQDYKSKAMNKAVHNAVITRSASGDNVSVISFGEERLIKGNIKWVTNYPQDANGMLRSDIEAVENLTTFLDYAITKAPFEFMEDENDRDAFDRVLLESTADDQNGTSYELTEYVDRNLPGWYETGLLTMRVIQE